MRNSASWIVLLVVLFVPTTSLAGVGRPNIFSALGLGIGGAGFAGVPNPTTLHYNPAGLVLTRQTAVLGGLELVIPPRQYEPLDGALEKGKISISPVPSAALSTRLARRGGVHPLPVALGLGFYSTFGGTLAFAEEDVQPGTLSQTMLMLELVPAVAYQVTRQLSLGVSVRIGFGSLSLLTNKREGTDTAPADLSGSGITVGTTLGGTYEPVPWLRIGVVYGSPMNVEIKGEGSVEVSANNWKDSTFSVEIPWPQWAAMGLALVLGESSNLYVGVRWTDWSSFDTMITRMSVIPDAIQDMNYDDSVSAHLGFESRLHDRFSLRGGISFDTSSIPDSSTDRVSIDMPKVTLAVGCSVKIMSSLILDVAYEALFGPIRNVPDVMGTEIDPVTGKPVDVHLNAEPGRYSSQIHSLALGVRYLY